MFYEEILQYKGYYGFVSFAFQTICHPHRWIIDVAFLDNEDLSCTAPLQVSDKFNAALIPQRMFEDLIDEYLRKCCAYGITPKKTNQDAITEALSSQKQAVEDALRKLDALTKIQEKQCQEKATSTTEPKSSVPEEKP